METHHRRPRLFDDHAHGLAERRARRRRWNAGDIDARLGIVRSEPIAPPPLRLRIGLRLGMAKEVHVERGVRLSYHGRNLLAQLVGREHGRGQRTQSACFADGDRKLRTVRTRHGRLDERNFRRKKGHG